jgi:hypothetical protein
MDEGGFGHPVRSLADVNPGDYYVQAVPHRYRTFRRANGHSVRLPMNRGYGDRAEHRWNGDATLPNALSRLHYNTMYVTKMLERMEKTAPPRADLTSWRY